MTPDDLICFKCKNWNQFDLGCRAFKEIPYEIINSNKHDKPLSEQKNDIVFEEGEPHDSILKITMIDDDSGDVYEGGVNLPPDMFREKHKKVFKNEERIKKRKRKR